MDEDHFTKGERLVLIIFLVPPLVLIGSYLVHFQSNIEILCVCFINQLSIIYVEARRMKQIIRILEISPHGADICPIRVAFCRTVVSYNV